MSGGNSVSGIYQSSEPQEMVKTVTRFLFSTKKEDLDIDLTTMNLSMGTGAHLGYCAPFVLFPSEPW